MFNQGWFKVKVIVQGKTLYDLGPLPNSINLTTILTNLTPFSMLQQMEYPSLPVIALVYDPIFM